MPNDSGPILSLDARYYTDPAIFEVESRGLLSASWQFAGHASQLQKPGDYFVFDMAGESLFASWVGMARSAPSITSASTVRISLSRKRQCADDHLSVPRLDI